MGAARLAVTMGLVGVAAGAVLAVATVPVFKPYLDRPVDRSVPVVVLSQDDFGNRQDRQSWSDDNGSQGDVRVRSGPQQGTLVLELPTWAAETGEWLAFGDRALRTWDEWTDPLAADRSEDRPYGLLPRVQRWLEEEGRSDTGPERWAPRQAPRSFDDTDASADQQFPDRWSDTASRAAERAREAARDVLAAEDAAQ